MVPFVQENNNLLNFNASFMADLESLHQSCGYADFIDRYMKFPPTEQQPAVNSHTVNATCDVFDLIDQAAFAPNPCFNIYEINQMCPIVMDVLSFPTQLVIENPGKGTYFNRTDVKQAIHAPLDVSWAECANQNVFVGNSYNLTGMDTFCPIVQTKNATWHPFQVLISSRRSGRRGRHERRSNPARATAGHRSHEQSARQ